MSPSSRTSARSKRVPTGQVRPESVCEAFESGLPPLVWLHGDEILLIQEAADAVRAAARAHGATERSLFESGRNFRFEQLAAEAGALSLFGEGKLLELRLGTRPGKEIGCALAQLAAELDDAVRVLVISPRLDRATTSSDWFGTLQGRTALVAIQAVARAQLPDWIGKRLAGQHQHVDRSVLEFIAARVEGNLLAADQEIRKLGLLFEAGKLEADAVRAAVLNVARYGAFDLVEPMLAADRARALRTLDGLRAEGEAGPLILWSVADALRTLLRLHEARATGRPLAPELRAARVFGPRERLFVDAASRLDPAVVRQALQDAALVDRMMKGLDRGDGWQALEALVMRLAGVRMPAAIADA